MRWYLAAIICLPTIAAAQNIYPDPGFENSGVVTEARSGQRAGRLAVGTWTHWAPLGGPLAVEPFATYRATAWVKGGTEGGRILALYTYEWDSYVWAFSDGAEVANTTEWRQVTNEFRAPGPYIFFYPLTFWDVDSGEAYVDDVVVEQIASPAETIAALQAKAELTENDTRLLGRWYLAQGDLAALRGLIGEARDPWVNADLAYLLAMATEDPTERLTMFVTMINNGAAGYNFGPRRLQEVQDKLDPAAAMVGLRAELARATTPDERLLMMRALTNLVEYQPTGPRTLGKQRRWMQEITELAAQLARPYAGQPDPPELTALGVALTEGRRRMERMMAELGRASVVLAGRELTPRSHEIVVAAEPTPSALRAAQDLQMHLERITGAEIPVVQGARSGGRAAIFVGAHPALAGLGVQPDDEVLGDEGILLRNVGADTVLYGGVRGVLYAVYTLLEDHLGCRWFTADCQTWPTAGRLVVPALNEQFVPALEYRATDYPNSRPPEFAVRNRLNGQLADASPEWGGRISYAGFVHTFNSLVPVETYFGTHPEYFSEINGERTASYTQLCLTNPDVLRLTIEGVRRWITEQPEATIVSVSQNDWRNPCQCVNCAAVVAEEGDAESGPLLRFVNAIARDIAEDYPHIVIDTLAYQYTRKPPLHVRPEPNVAIRLCSIECEFNRPLETSEYNRTFVDDIRGWNEISDRLHIWDYVINYAHSIQPFPNFDVLAPNIQFFINNGVTGIYEEANYYSRGGEMAELRTYVMTKLLWKPDYDVATAIREFCDAYYGPASPMIQEYLADTHRLAVSDPGFHMNIYHSPQAPFTTPEALGRYTDLFARAEAAVAGDETLTHRVRVAKMPILYSRIATGATDVYHLEGDALVRSDELGLTELVEEMAEIGHAEGVTHIREGGTFDAWLAGFSPAQARYDLLPLRGGLTALALPALGGRLWSLRTADGVELLQTVRRHDGYAPEVGGYEEFALNEYRAPGWREPYQVVARDTNSATVSAELNNGLRVTRRYEVDPRAPRLTVTTTAANIMGDEVAAAPRSHPCFALTNAAKAVVSAGDWQVPVASNLSAETEHWLSPAATATGEIRVAQPVAGYDLVVRYDPAVVNRAYVNWNAPEQRINIELFSAPKTLPASGETTLRQTIEWVPTGA